MDPAGNTLTGALMGWTGNVFQVLIVVSGPNFTGFFVYNGTPAKGNLVAAIVAPGTTNDPFGNTVGAVANFGTWSAVTGALLQHFGIDQFGNTYLANTAGLTVVQGASGDGSMRFYTTGGQALGNLAASIAPATGTDAVGNTYQAGITAYLASLATTFAQLLSGSLTFGLASNVLNASVSEGSSGVNISNLVLVSATDSTRTRQATLRLQPVAAGAEPLLVAPSVLAIAESTTGTPAVNTIPQIFGNASGHVSVVSDSTNGDSNSYDTERLTLILGSAVTIDTTGENVFSKPLGLGKYVVEVWMVTSNTIAADFATWGFTFTGTVAVPVLMKFESKTQATPSTLGYGASSTLTTTFNGQNFAGNQDVYMRATLNVSVAGTLAIHGSTAASTVTVFAGATMEIRPVVAS